MSLAKLLALTLLLIVLFTLLLQHRLTSSRKPRHMDQEEKIKEK
ncbi:MAG: hypothetical protein QXK95_03520 [Nitrososphaerota archaeon]